MAILKHNDIPFVQMQLAQPDFLKVAASLDLFIYRWAHYDSDRQKAMDILPVVEKDLGIKCYPDQNTCWHYDDKIKQYLLMKAHGFPMVESYIFWDKSAALEWIEQAEMPVVFKLRGGAGSQNVILVRQKTHGQKLIRRMFGKGIRPSRVFDFNDVRFKHFNFRREVCRLIDAYNQWRNGLDLSPFWQTQKNYALFQKFLPGNEFDTRVTVIGDRAFAFRRMVRKNDFRASGSGMINYDIKAIDMRCVEIALKVSRQMHFQSMAYDFIFDAERKPWFCEISYTYLSSAVQRCPGYWDANLNWHEGHFWPEYLQLVDALNLPDLKAPDLEPY